MITTCLAGAKSQQWQLAGAPGKQQIKSMATAGACIARPPPQQQREEEKGEIVDTTSEAVGRTSSASGSITVTAADGSSSSMAGTGSTTGSTTGSIGPSIVSDSPQLVFDVSSLGAGWEKGAHVRDLWAHKDLGVMTKVLWQRCS
jgi:hypothetical protein